MTDQVNNNQGAGNPVSFQPQAQAQGDIDAKAAASSMILYGLDPSNAEAANEFARHFVDDSERNDPILRDRYQRAARAAATNLRQQEAMQRLGSLSDPRLAQDRDALWKIANYKAAPLTEQTKRQVSVLDSTDRAELWNLSQGKGSVTQDPNDSVNAEAWRRMADAGVVIDSDDPESKMIDTSSPERFLASIDKAIEAKQSKSVLDITDPGELFRLAKKQGLI